MEQEVEFLQTVLYRGKRVLRGSKLTVFDADKLERLGIAKKTGVSVPAPFSPTGEENEPSFSAEAQASKTPRSRKRKAESESSLSTKDTGSPRGPTSSTPVTARGGKRATASRSSKGSRSRKARKSRKPSEE